MMSYDGMWYETSCRRMFVFYDGTAQGQKCLLKTSVFEKGGVAVFVAMRMYTRESFQHKHNISFLSSAPFFSDSFLPL